MATAGTAWYKDGTVTVTKNSTTVTGSGTAWVNAGIRIGDSFTIDRKTWYEIAAVNSNTSITLQQAYDGETTAGLNYCIMRNMGATTTDELASRVAVMTNKYESYIDADLQKITGPAADFSKQYKGLWASGKSYKAMDTVQLDSKIYVAMADHTSSTGNNPINNAGSVWLELNSSIPTDVFGYNNAGLHNSIYRGKYLGDTITDAQWAEIKSGRFTDLYPGDYWRFSFNLKGITSKDVSDQYGGQSQSADDIRELDLIGFRYQPCIHILECDYAYGTAPGSKFRGIHNLLVGFKIAMWLHMQYDNTAINDEGFSGTELYKITLPGIYESLCEIVGPEHIGSLYNDYISSDKNGGLIRNGCDVTLGPLSLYYKFTDVSKYPPGIFDHVPVAFTLGKGSSLPLYGSMMSFQQCYNLTRNFYYGNNNRWLQLDDHGYISTSNPNSMCHKCFIFFLI